MDLKSPHSLQQKFLAADMRSDAPSSTTTSTLACDIGSFLSFSCRTRAEDFARTLQNKLKTLGSFDTLGNDSSTVSLNSLVEPPWKALSLDSHLSRQKQKPENSGGGQPLSTITLNMTNSKTLRGNSVETSGESGSAQTSIDSDIYYDFDLGSPGSPVERGPACYTVINPCDDLYCTACLQNTTSQSSVPFDGLESGCIFTSPITMSPNNEIELLPPVFNIQHSNSAEDCTSDTSDCSIYYDVEPYSPIVSPTPELEPELPAVSEPVPSKDASLPVETPEPVTPRVYLPKIIEPTVNTIEEMKQLLSTIGSYSGDGGSSGSEDEDSGIPKIPRITRSSSLKTGKTPPGTPGKKKIVRFADALGLDLAAVRTFLDEIPKVPKSAFRDLDYPLESLSSPFSLVTPPFQKSAKEAQLNKMLVATFHQPVSRPDFFDRIRDNKVFLENAYFSDNFTIKGAVRVLNMDFHKSVYIRYTYDEWKTFTDFQASYVNGSCDGFSDRFEFTVNLRPDLVEIGSRVILAVRFHCKGEQFWDNNSGADYLFHCVMGTAGPQLPAYHSSSIYPSMYGTSPDDPWANHMWF